MEGKHGRVAVAAHRLARAAASGEPCAPVRDLIGPDEAYAVQQVGIRARVGAGAVVTGHKIGLTSPSVQRQLGVDQPDFGVLLDTMQVPDGGTVPDGALLQARVEGELAFVLATDLPDPGEDLRIVRAAIAYATAAIEVVDSRITGWDITFADTVADNGSSGMYVLGPERLGLTEFAPVDVSMTLTRREPVQAERVVSTGVGSACLGDPLRAVAWLAATLDRAGTPLRAGEVVLSGALGPMVETAPGATYALRLERDGATLSSCSVTFAGPDHAEEVTA